MHVIPAVEINPAFFGESTPIYPLSSAKIGGA
jgi:hypothetical protein